MSYNKSDMEKKVFVYKTSIGNIGIAELDGHIIHLFFENANIPEEFIREETPLLKKAAMQLNEYLEGKRFDFDLPLQPEGTEFEKKCWNALLRIPYGETRTYGEQARLVGNAKASRAVGRANSVNPIAVFIPCHRVIGANGTLTGFAGGIDIKKQLLELEQKNALRHGLTQDLFTASLQ